MMLKAIKLYVSVFNMLLKADGQDFGIFLDTVANACFSIICV